MSKLYNLLEQPEKGMLVYIPTDRIDPHPDNPRKDLGDLTELADSIRQNGILQNLTVVPQENGRYRALIGHRRLAAAQLAGLTEVPCVVVEMSQKEQLGVMFAENVQRADLTPYEQAECLQMMIDLGETAAAVAQRTGLSEATVSRRLRLLKLDQKKFDQAQDRGGASMDQYIKIAEIKSAADRKELLDAVGSDNFNARYRRALKDQAIKELQPQAVKEAETFAKPAPKNVSNWSSGYRTEVRCNIDEWKPGALIINKPKKDGEYFYYIGYGTIYILLKEEKAAGTANKISEKEKAARKRRRELSRITEEMYELRREFMMNFTAGLKNKDVLFEYALAQMVGRYAGSLYHTTFDKKPLQEKIEQDPEKTYSIDKDLLKAFYDKDPGAAMALIVYCNSGDSKESGYYNQGYGESMPYHRNNRDLDVLYEYLCRLGYRMCDEEKQLQDGTHPLFQKEV